MAVNGGGDGPPMAVHADVMVEGKMIVGLWETADGADSAAVQARIHAHGRELVAR